MNNERLMLKGIFLGVAAGAALSSLHKPTRQACGMRWLTCKHKLSLYKSNPELLKNTVITKVDEAKKLAQTLSKEVDFVNKQVKELKKTTPQVMELVQQTKEHFTKNNQTCEVRRHEFLKELFSRYTLHEGQSKSAELAYFFYCRCFRF